MRLGVVEIKLESKFIEKHLQNSPVRFKKGCIKGWRKAGQIVRDEIRKLIKNPPKTGRKYGNLPNRSSAPGESPAYQYGGLSKTTTYKALGWNRMEVGYQKIYGLYLERGTSRIKPRPALSSAVSQTYGAVRLALGIEIRRELEKTT